MRFNLREIFGIILRPPFFVFLIMCTRTYIRKLIGLSLYLTHILIGVVHQPTLLRSSSFFRPDWTYLSLLLANILTSYSQISTTRRNTPFCCRLLIVSNKRNILRLCLMRETRTRREGAIILMKSIKIGNKPLSTTIIIPLL